MKLYAPKYYNEFNCIADKCRHSCCVGWEIDVDPVSMEKYRVLGDRKILDSIDGGVEPHFRLGDGERCPHLCESGLCRIILEYGDEYLCHICREHPRFFNYTAMGCEVGLGMSCEEACRIILSSDSYAEMTELGEADGDMWEYSFDSLACRKKIYSVLGDNRYTYVEKLKEIAKEYRVSPEVYTGSEWRKTVEELEFMHEENRKVFSCYTSEVTVPAELEKPLERALAYFIYRHCSEACDIDEFRAALGFCLFCERLLASLAVKTQEEIVELARTLSEEIEYSVENTERIIEIFSAL